MSFDSLISTVSTKINRQNYHVLLYSLSPVIIAFTSADRIKTWSDENNNKYSQCVYLQIEKKNKIKNKTVKT